MATTSFIMDGKVGIETDARSTANSAGFALGTTARGDSNTVWIYVKASGSVATGTCTMASATFLLTDASGIFTADTAFADGEYGWVRLTAGDVIADAIS